jgi:hypothetical protein
MPKTGANPITLLQRLQMRPLCRRAPDLGVPLDTVAGETNQMRQLQTSPSQSGVRGEGGGDERGKTGIGRLPCISLYSVELP